MSADGGHGGESGFAINMNADGSEVLHVKLKMELGLFDKYTRQRNMPGGRKGAIRAYEKARVKNLLQTAYDFDRTNYGNYNALNFFYVTNAKRRDGLRSIDDAISLGRQTLEACEKYKSVDLQDALTAAVAAENILIWQDSLSRVRGGSLDELSKSHKRLVKEYLNYQRVMGVAVEDGSLNVYSQARIDEMAQRFGVLRYSVREYKKKIERLQAAEE